jgi:hypothetical protein
MSLRLSMLKAVSGVALLAIAVAPPAFAKPKDKSSGEFSVACLVGDANPATVTVTPATLWPPNHKMDGVIVSMSLDSDAASAVPVSLTISGITDDQASADDSGGAGCGKPTSKQGADWLPTDLGSSPIVLNGSLELTTDTLATDPGEIQLRSERCARLGTRTYEISVVCCDLTDAMNPVCDPSAETLDVTVKESHGKVH